MAVPVEALFRQNAWSTERLIEACEALTDEELDAPAPGTYGSIRDTLVHIVAAEQRYIRRLGGTPTGNAVGEDEPVALSVLKQIVRGDGEVLASMAASAPTDWRVAGVTEYGVKFDTEGVVFLLQTVNHAAGHRAQVVGMLTSLGIGPKDLDEQIDAWSWGVSTGALRVEAS